MTDCLRVYNSGERVRIVCSDKAEAIKWAADNEIMRFGCATFISGKCYYKGYLNDDRIKDIEQELNNEK